MRFGFETVIWGRRIYDLELALEQIAACGYEGVEFSQAPADLLVRDSSIVRGWRPVGSIGELTRLLEKKVSHSSVSRAAQSKNASAFARA